MVSLIAITLLIAIPAIDEIARRLLEVSPATESLRTRLALAMMIPFGIVVVVREFLSRRALIRAGQDLATTREQLVQREKLAAVGQLVSGVAHELNNPLQGVLGYAELMLATRPAALETEELRAIRDNANRAAGIVRNLLTFAGRTASARGWQQINRVVRDAIAAREPQLAGRGHRSHARRRRSAAAGLRRSHAARRRDRQSDPERRGRHWPPARRQGRWRARVPEKARGEIRDLDPLARAIPTASWSRSPTTAAACKDEDLTARLRSVLHDPRSRARAPALASRSATASCASTAARSPRAISESWRRDVHRGAAGDGRIAGGGECRGQACAPAAVEPRVAVAPAPAFAMVAPAGR